MSEEKPTDILKDEYIAKLKGALLSANKTIQLYREVEAKDKHVIAALEATIAGLLINL